MTPLDAVHEAMQDSPDDAAARLRFYGRLVETELILWLTKEAEGDRVEPEVFTPETGPMVLAFDTEDRLAAFAGRPVPYAALPGRALVTMLSGQGVWLGLNLDVAPSSILIPPDAVDWLAGMLSRRPAQALHRPLEVAPPAGLPESFLPVLEAKLAAAAGLAAAACLARVRYDGASGHLLAFLDAAPGAEAVLARAVGEALAFSGTEEGALDVAFLGGTDPAATRLLRAGLKIDLSVPSNPLRTDPDPARPPRLK